MNIERGLLNSLTIEQLEEMVIASNKKEDLERELARTDFIERSEEARERWINKRREHAETQKELQDELLQKLADKKLEEDMLANSSPELVNAVANIKLLEAQLAEKELENKRLTALVYKLELKIRDLRIKSNSNI
jgi:hypothetical protein